MSSFSRRSFYLHRLAAVIIFFILSYLCVLSAITFKNAQNELFATLTEFIQIMYFISYIYCVSVLGFTASMIFCLICLGVIFGTHAFSFTPVFLWMSGAVAVVTFALLAYKQKKLSEFNSMNLQIEQLNEKLNLLIDELHLLAGKNDALKSRINSIIKLRDIIEKLTLTLSLENLYSRIISATFDIIPKTDVCLLWEYDEQSGRMNMHNFKSKLPLITAHEYTAQEPFYDWTSQNRKTLSIEDISSDFRFDAQKLKLPYTGYIKSIVVVPLELEGRLTGFIRCDSSSPCAFQMDEIRTLYVIAHIFAISIRIVNLYLKTKELALKDGLTQLYGRRYFDIVIRNHISQTKRKADTTFLSILLLDIDHFKQCNDTFGHIIGDKVLIKFASILKEVVGSNGIPVRFGGEEFAVILPDTTKTKAVQIAELIRKTTSETEMNIRRKKITINISAGVASYPIDADTITELIRTADEALYTAKREGRNRVACMPKEKQP